MYGPDYRNLLDEWFRRIRENQYIHYRCANHFSALNRWIGVSAIQLSFFVSTAVFASIQTEATGGWKIVMAVSSLVAGGLSLLHTFFGYSERAESHRRTAAKYADLRRQIEEVWFISSSKRINIVQRISAIRLESSSIAENSAEVPQRIKNYSMKKIVTKSLFDLSLDLKAKTTQ